MTTERQPATFEFACDGPVWNGTPVVNGHKIVSASQIDVRIDARDAFPEVTLKLTVTDALKLGFDVARMCLDDGTRDALISLGWTPPDNAEVTEPAPRRNEITEA